MNKLYVHNVNKYENENSRMELKPTLSEQINNAEKSKGANDVGRDERAPEIDAQSFDDLERE